MAGSNSITSCCRACGQLLKWIPVVFIVVVLIWSWYAYVLQLCVAYAETVVQKVFYIVIYHALLMMLSWSYWQTIFTPVGTVPKQFRLTAADIERFEQAEGSLEIHQQILEQIARNLPVQTRTPVGPRYCEKCIHIKPDRAHHCSVCGCCVTKMDHHCPWVNNCVGFSNYKFFILFLGYAFTYCIFVAFTSLPYFIQFWKNNLDGGGKFHVLFLFFVSVMFSISLVSLWGYHIYLVLHNRSTLEAFRAPMFRSGADKDGFNLGKYNNFVEVFGDRKLYWFLPVFTSLGDGLTFKVRGPPTVVVVSTTQPVVLTTDSSSLPVVDPLEPLKPVLDREDATTEPADNMGDGISFPQRHMDEDEDSLLGGRSQRWMEEGGPELSSSSSTTNGRNDHNSYHVVNIDPAV